jgi:phage baseplate assembly protein gpV
MLVRQHVGRGLKVETNLEGFSVHPVRRFAVGTRAQVALVSLAATIVALLGLPAQSLAAGSGTASIEGVVTQAQPPKGGIEGVCVEAIPVGSGTGAFAETKADGSYKLEGLKAGSYEVFFANCFGGAVNVLPRWWDEQSKASKAEELTLAEGEKRTGVDAAMSPGGEIAGRLLNGKGTPLSGVCVTAFNPEGSEEGTFTFGESSANGEYLLPALQTGRYIVEYFPCGTNVLGAYYDASSESHRTTSSGAASSVMVEAGTATVELAEVSLEAGAELEGTLTDSEGAPVIAPMCVYAINAAKEAVAHTRTTAGHYKLESLASGSYALYAEECPEFKSALLWASQYYNDASSLSSATRVTLTAGIEPPVPVTVDFTLVRATASKPVNIALPAITGTPAPGQRLSCSTGAWGATPPPTYSYQWMRDGVTAIPGALGSQYIVQSADEGAALSCVVKATNEAGSASASSATVQVPSKPAPVGVATASRGAKVNAGAVEVTLACAGGECKGTVKLIATVKAKATKRHHRPKAKSVVIGEASFSIRSGGHQTLRIHLTREGRRLLAAAGKHGLKVQLAGIDVESRILVLKAPKQAHHHARKR